MKRFIGIALFLIVYVHGGPLMAQTLDPSTAKEELERRGLEEAEVKKRMLERGIDIDNIDPTNASEILEAEQALEEVVLELEQEKQALEATEDPIDAEQENDKETDPPVEPNPVETPNPANEVEPQKASDEKEPPSTLYGQQIFRDKTLSVFNQAANIRPSNDYILGAGDVVNISIWGASQVEVDFTIKEEGYIKPPRMPRISLQGKTFNQARDLIRSRYAQYYSFNPEEFEVTITFARNVTINILGEVYTPGTFILPATNTAFNALVAAGGPSNIGSVRNIRLIRGGESTRQIDVYEFMNDPSVREQFYLQDNDILHVGTLGRTARISGAIRKPFRFELSSGENLKKLIDYAGGLNDNAYRGNIQVKRFVDDEEKIIDVNYRELLRTGRDFEILSGDEVLVQDIPKPYKNYVEIDGAVGITGKFELTAGMRITDLLTKGGLLEEARTDIAFLLRTRFDGTTGYERINIGQALQDPLSASNLTLQPKDRLRILSQKVYVDQATIEIVGAVREPGEQELDVKDDLKLEDAIILAGGLRPDATDFAYIYRESLTNPKEREYIRVNLKNAIDNPNSPDNITLEPLDRIEVLSKSTFVNEAKVIVAGAVREPGDYTYDESLTLKDLLTLAGGLRLEAASSRIDIFRVVIEENEPTKTIVATVEVDDQFNLLAGGSNFVLEPYDQVVVRTVPGFELQQNVTLRGEVSFPGTYALIEKNEKLLSVITRSGGLTEEAFLGGATLFRPQEDVGYVILNLNEVMNNPSSRYNFILKEGDIIEIPKKKDLVTILLGATKAEELYPDKVLKSGKLNVAYEEGRNSKWYVDKYAAGIGDNGRKSLVTVEYSNGQIEKTKGFIFKRYPEVKKGATIKVGYKPIDPEKAEEEKEEIDWGKVLADSITQATAILTIILLIQRLD